MAQVPYRITYALLCLVFPVAIPITGHKLFALWGAPLIPRFTTFGKFNKLVVCRIAFIVQVTFVKYVSVVPAELSVVVKVLKEVRYFGFHTKILV
jgi:hypothetical protein